jgi:polyphenol oxidase
VGRATEDDLPRVLENERIILRTLGLDDRVARLRLEHGARVVRPAGPGTYGPADALLTDDPGLVLWFTVADCVPVTLAAGSWRAHGHCGWRGTAAGILEAMVAELMRSAGVSPQSLRAWAGPGIGPCCFEVGPEVAAIFDRDALRFESPSGGGPEARIFLDLRAEIALRLRRLGLPPPAITIDTACTACERARFFSHRRDGIPTGRMAAFSFSAIDGVRRADPGPPSDST